MRKKELEKCLELHAEVKSLCSRRERLTEAATRITTQISDEPKNEEYRDKLAEYAAKLDALNRLYAGRIIELEAQIRIIELELRDFPQQQQTVLRLRYIDGLGWEEVARQANYTIRHCYKIHEAALKKMMI